jgi:hypothetical protein
VGQFYLYILRKEVTTSFKFDNKTFDLSICKGEDHLDGLDVDGSVILSPTLNLQNIKPENLEETTWMASEDNIKGNVKVKLAGKSGRKV